MREGDIGQLGPVLGLMVLQPQDLGGCETRHQRPVPLLGQILGLGCALHITPQLCISDDLHSPKQAAVSFAWIARIATRVSRTCSSLAGMCRES